MSVSARQPLKDLILDYEKEHDFLELACMAVTDSQVKDGTVTSIANQLLAVVDGVGVGLAANQIGYPYRIVVMDLGHGMETFINPEIHDETEKTIDSTEGCLSSLGKQFIVKRMPSLTLKFLDLKGRKVTRKLSGFPAIVAQHECDHIDGRLICQHGIPILTGDNA